MESLKTSIKSWFANLESFLTKREEQFMIGISDKTEVSYGWEDDINKEYCNSHNIPHYFMNRNGGTIVHFKDNIALVWIYNNRIYKKLMFVALIQDLAEHLKEKGLNVELQGNDILVDGFKVASCHSYNLAPDYTWTYEGMQISMNVDLDIIKNVCKKEMKKVPKGLQEYNITTNEIVEFIENWIDKEKINNG